jgi:hypothetical protein
MASGSGKYAGINANRKTRAAQRAYGRTSPKLPGTGNF